MSTALFVGGFPGGMEIAVIFLIAIILFGLPLILVVVFGSAWLARHRGDDEAGSAEAERIAELEAEVERLRDRLDDVEGGEE